MRRRRIKQIILFMLLHLITLFILLLPLQQGHFFGTNGDWYSQHIAIADSLRKAMLQSRSLVPQFIELGGGRRIFFFCLFWVLWVATAGYIDILSVPEDRNEIFYCRLCHPRCAGKRRSLLYLAA